MGKDSVRALREAALLASLPEPQGVSALSGNDQPRWQAGSFAVATTTGLVEIAGWIKLPFALDFRVYDGGLDGVDAGWHLTHVPTGYSICGFVSDIDRAKDLADQALTIANWDFVDPAGAKKVKADFQKFRKQHSTLIVRAGAQLASPLTCQAA